MGFVDSSAVSFFGIVARSNGDPPQEKRSALSPVSIPLFVLENIILFFV